LVPGQDLRLALGMHNTTARPSRLSAEEMQHRRELAVRRVSEGYTQRETAAFLEVHEDTVGHWMRQYRQGGSAALEAVPHTGNPSRLSEAQWQEVCSWLEQNPTELGYPDELWTSRRVADQIAQRFGVQFHYRYVSGQLLRRRITPQIPAERPRERDEELIQQWLEQEWPRILKKRPPTPPISS
jgi:transposase